MKFEPHPYQRYAIARIQTDPALGLFLDMGLGKTVITLTAIQELRGRFQVRRPLIIAPKKVAEATWTAECAKWDHLAGLRVAAVLGPAKRRQAALLSPADLWVINRENVPWLVDYYRTEWPFDMVVLDESSSFKSSRSARFKALRRVRPRIDRLVELTGTPTPNSLEDLWSQVYLLDGGQRLGRSLGVYRETFFHPDPGRPGQPYRTYSPQEGALERVRAEISDICVSMSARDYLTLPPLLEEDHPVALSPAAEKAYTTLEKKLLLEVDEHTVTASSAAVLAGKLLQLCSGALYDEAHRALPVHSCKLEALLELVEQLHGEHALICYWYRHSLTRLLPALRGAGLRCRVYSSGEDALAWNRGEVDLLLIHPRAAAYGLNLQQGGRHVIWFDLPSWNLELYQQASARLYRQGQPRPVVVHHLTVQGSVEEDMLTALRGKGDMQEALLSALKARLRRVKAETPQEAP